MTETTKFQESNRLHPIDENRPISDQPTRISTQSSINPTDKKRIHCEDYTRIFFKILLGHLELLISQIFKLYKYLKSCLPEK